MTKRRDRPPGQRHSWLQQPDELRDHLKPAPPRESFARTGLDGDERDRLSAWRSGIEHQRFLRDQVQRGSLGGRRDGLR
jgi:hypothetical protein